MAPQSPYAPSAAVSSSGKASDQGASTSASDQGASTSASASGLGDSADVNVDSRLAGTTLGGFRPNLNPNALLDDVNEKQNCTGQRVRRTLGKVVRVAGLPILHAVAAGVTIAFSVVVVTQALTVLVNDASLRLAALGLFSGFSVISLIRAAIMIAWHIAVLVYRLARPASLNTAGFIVQLIGQTVGILGPMVFLIQAGVLGLLGTILTTLPAVGGLLITMLAVESITFLATIAQRVLDKQLLQATLDAKLEAAAATGA